jgi:hypothetical protein
VDCVYVGADRRQRAVGGSQRQHAPRTKTSPFAGLGTGTPSLSCSTSAGLPRAVWNHAMRRRTNAKDGQRREVA